MFSSYQISNPAASNNNGNRKNAVKSANESCKPSAPNIPRRRATISAQDDPVSPVAVKRQHSTSPDTSNSDGVMLKLPSECISDPKLNKKCAVVIERSEEVVKFERQQIAFINGLLEKQREMQRQRALQREELKRLLKEKGEQQQSMINEISEVNPKENPDETNPTTDELRNSPVRRKIVKKIPRPLHRYQREKQLEQERRKSKSASWDQHKENKKRDNVSESDKEGQRKGISKGHAHIDNKAPSQSSQIISTHLENEWNSSNITLTNSMTQQVQVEEIPTVTLNNSNRDDIIEQPKTSTHAALPMRKTKSIKRQLQKLRNRVEVRQCMADPSSEDCSLYGSKSPKPSVSPTKLVKVRLKRARLDEDAIPTSERPTSDVDPIFEYQDESKSLTSEHTILAESPSNDNVEFILSSEIRSRVNDIKQRLKAQLFQMNEKYGSTITRVVEEALIKSTKRGEAKRIPFKIISKRMNRKARKRLPLAKQKTKSNNRLGARKVIKYYATYEEKVKAQLEKQAKKQKRQQEKHHKAKQKYNRSHERRQVRTFCETTEATCKLVVSNQTAEEATSEDVSKDVEQATTDTSVTKVVINTTSVDKQTECVELTDNFDSTSKPVCDVGTVTDETSEEANSSVVCKPSESPSSRSDDEIEISKEMAAAATSLTMLANKKSAAMTMTLTITSRVLESESGEAILATAIGLPPPTPTESITNITVRPEPITMIGDAATITSKCDDSGAAHLAQAVSEEEDASSEYLPLSQQVRTVNDLKNIVEATTVNVIKDATMTLLSFEATATLPTYLFNGESRDMPTPTPTQALMCNATTASVAAATPASAAAAPPAGVAEKRIASPFPLLPPPISTTSLAAQVKNHEQPSANKALNNPSAVGIDPVTVIDKLALSTSDHEVSSTQETVADIVERTSNHQVKASELHDTGDTSTMVQNNQIDTTHHFLENTYNSRRRLRKYSDEFTSRLIEDTTQHKKRRKTICSESSLRVQFAPDTLFYGSSGGSSPSTTTVREAKGRKRGRPPKNREKLTPPPNTPTRCALRSFALAFSPPYTFDLVEAPEVKIPSVIPPINHECLKRTHSKGNVEEKGILPPDAERCLDEKEIVPQVETTTMICESSQLKRKAKNGELNSNLSKNRGNAKQNNYTSVKGVRMKIFPKDDTLAYANANANAMRKVDVPKKAVRNAARKRK